MKRFVSFLVFATLFFGFIINAKEKKTSEYLQYVAEITRAFSKQIKNEFGLECAGRGGCMPYDVEKMSIDFVAYQRATIEQARELEVKIIEKFIQMINSHEKIRPFLREYPFPPCRARVSISFRQKNNSPYLDGSVAYVFQAKNRIHYDAENPNNPYVFIDLKDEPYEEALKIVRRNEINESTKFLRKLD